MQLGQLPRLIMEKMSQDGHQCYLVGGSVRDLFMSKEPADYDFVTDRLPDQILSLATQAGWKAREQGRAFGIIQIIIGKKSYEVASMRAEEYGKDPHRPEKVVFIGDLQQDLARRDFTMNAIALGKNGKLIDPFGGIDDIKKGIIRAIGDPQARFLEDPLRVLRAARFAVQMGFSIEKAIPPAMMKRDVQERFRGLSVERIRDEFEKILLAPGPSRGLRLLADTGILGLSCTQNRKGRKTGVDFLPEVMQLDGIPQNPRYHNYDVLTHTLKVIDKVASSPVLRWSALLHDVAKGRPGVRTINKRGEISDFGHHLLGAKIARKILGRLKVSKAYTRRITWLIKNHQNLPSTKVLRLTKWIIKKARDFTNRHEFREAARQLFLLGQADDASKGREANSIYFHLLLTRFPEIIAALVLYPGELEISGSDIVEVTGSGPIVGKILYELLADVQGGKVANLREDLLGAIQEKINI